MNREKEEKNRVNILFGIKNEIEKEEDVDRKNTKPIYNSMYHPELARKR